MMSDVVVRPATKNDLTAARHVIVETWRTTYAPIHGAARVEDIISRWHTPDVLEQQIAADATLFAIAEINDQCMGHIHATPHADDLKINRLYVLPNAQGNGLGRALMDFALSAYPHAQTINLEVDEANENAIAFYKKLGMAITGSTPCCGDDSDIAALIMSAPRDNIRFQ